MDLSAFEQSLGALLYGNDGSTEGCSFRFVCVCDVPTELGCTLEQCLGSTVLEESDQQLLESRGLYKKAVRRRRSITNGNYRLVCCYKHFIYTSGIRLRCCKQNRAEEVRARVSTPGQRGGSNKAQPRTACGRGPRQQPSRISLSRSCSMDQQAATLLSTLKRPSVPSESKINLLNALKSDIKHYRVPETAQAPIFECLKLAIVQQASSALASTAFSTLGHLIKRLKIQDASGKAITQLAPRLLTALQERMGDQREPVRTATSQALTELYPFCSNDIEQIVRDEAISGSNPRAKETGMRWVLRMHQDTAMPFKGYTSSIVARLEDADSNVREAGKTVLTELFANAPDRAKLDLKRQLKAHSVRYAIESQVLSQIGAPSSSRPQTSGNAEGDTELAGSTRSLPAVDHATHSAETTTSDAAQASLQESDSVEPLYIHSQRELEELFRDMLPPFEGKETEQNWGPRDKTSTKIRRLLKGNAANEYHQTFMAGIKSVVEGILKVANSLRTTLATNGCMLVRDLARVLGPALDPHVEMILQSFIKMSAATKHIAAENGRITADAIFQNCSYHLRMIQHIWSAIQEKNVQQRQCAPEWLKTVLKRQASYKQHFESSGGLDLTEKCIKKGLDDANPKVREIMRVTYWTFAKSWPDKAGAIMSKLDAKSKTALERDPNNPNAILHSSLNAAPSNARAAGSSSRSALREMVAQQKKAKAAGILPERPNSAMATLSPSKSRSNANLNGSSRAVPSNLSQMQRNEARAPSAASNASTTEPPASSTAKKGGSLMSGPVRRPRRHEIQRPQTADPYASKRMHRPETPGTGSPVGSPQKGTGASKTSVLTSSAIKNRAKTSGKAAGSPSGSPALRGSVHGYAHPQLGQSTDSRPTSKGSIVTTAEDASIVHEDDFTMVLPHAKNTGPLDRNAFSPGHRRRGLGQTASVDSGIPALAEEEGLTLVLPNLQSSQTRARSPLAYRSPMKAMFEDARERVGKLSPEAQRHFSNMDYPEGEDVVIQGGTPKQAVPSPEEVQIYQDPVTDDEPTSGTYEQREVLVELPINENMRLTSPTRSNEFPNSPAESPQHVSDTRSPNPTNLQDRSDVLRNRKLLTSGIERIRAKNLDVHGFRRMQELAKSKLDIWDGGRKYDELMSALLEYLQTLDQSQPASKVTGLKVQALGLVRALLTVHRKSAVTWHAQTLVAVLVCQQGVDPSSHLLVDVQRTAEEIIQHAMPEACIDAILDFLPPPGEDAITPRSTAMALAVLRRLVATSKERNADLQPSRRSRLAQAAASYLNDSEPEVRKADIDLASELFDIFGPSKADFWVEFKGVDEGRLGLLTYYIAKRGQSVAAA